MREKQLRKPLNFAPAAPSTENKQRMTTALEKSVLSLFLKILGNPAIAVELWDGSRIYTSQRPSIGTVRLTSPKALNCLLLAQDIGFGDCYSDGNIEIKGDLTAVMEEFYQARHGMSPVVSFFSKLLRKRPRLNNLEGSRSNIHHHYDLSNKFYQLWLDKEMQYSCAYFAQPSMTLEQAQLAKMEHICRKINLQLGDMVVDVGGGWGSLARYMALHYDVQVRAYNISQEQVDYGRQRAKEEGYGDKVTYVLEDYRNIEGEYDKFVSVGMFEHVGVANYQNFGRVIGRCLKKGGRGLVQTIGRNSPGPTNAWIEKRIFPGGYTPTLREMMNLFEASNFSVLDVENLRLHYAATLDHWRRRFEDNCDTVAEMFDLNFLRAWRLYLCGSIAAFRVGTLQLF